jgi:hypothetical protein
MKYLADVFLILASSAILGCFYFILRQPSESGQMKFQEMMGRCVVATVLSFACLVVLGFIYFIMHYFITGTD